MCSSDLTTRRVVEAHHRLHELLAEMLPPALRWRSSVAPLLILYDEELQPASSQEVIRQMMRRADAPEADFGGMPGGRGLRLPSAAPTIFTSARFNWGLALAASYYVEGANLSSEGLGAIGRAAAAQNEADALWGAVFATAALGLLGLFGLSVLQRLVLRWHVSQRPQRR